jgi:hypothetical protein
MAAASIAWIAASGLASHPAAAAATLPQGDWRRPCPATYRPADHRTRPVDRDPSRVCGRGQGAARLLASLGHTVEPRALADPDISQAFPHCYGTGTADQMPVRHRPARLGHAWGMKQRTTRDNSGFRRTVVMRLRPARKARNSGVRGGMPCMACKGSGVRIPSAPPGTTHLLPTRDLPVNAVRSR